MPSNEPQRRSRSRSNSAGSRKSRASEYMRQDGGEAGRRMAEDEYIRRELHQDASVFCNAFWGSHDAGFDVIQHRMKVANRTMDEVRQLYKERAEIEVDYAKRLSKLGKLYLGKEETGATRQALEIVRSEIEMTAQVHSDLSTMIRKDLEGSLAEFQTKIASARKSSAAAIERLHKNKQAQESFVNKSRERYEQDCIKINGYTAQSSLVQGRDLDKVTSKLDKAQSTVVANDKDYQNFVRALKDTTHRWNSDFKSYLDQCQDLEEERLDFLKSNLWNYANAISAVCVADDEGCERVRVALENCDTPTDIVDFIQCRGTGPAIPDPPEYINYAKGQPPPARPSFHMANFQRTTNRAMQPPAPAKLFMSGDGNAHAGGGAVTSIPMHSESGGPISTPPKDPRNGAFPSTGPSDGGFAAANADIAGPPPAPPAQFKPLSGSTGLPGMAPPSTAETKNERRMSTKKFLARTSSMAQREGPGADVAPTSARPPDAVAAAAASSPKAPGLASDEDPIAKALANLRARPGGKSPTPGAGGGPPSRPMVGQDGSYRPNSRQQQHPSQIGRAPSPSAGIVRPSSPSAAFMQAPQRAASPLPVEEVVGKYGQSFPGERRALSRQNSVASTVSHRSCQPLQSPTKTGAPHRAKSPGPVDGFAGVGARGRSPSPQPYGDPLSGLQQQRPQAPPPTSQPTGSSEPPRQRITQAPPRSSTPLGISLDASGSVTHDQMAHQYMQRAGSVPPQIPSFQYPQQHQQPYDPPSHQHQQRPASVVYGHQQPHQAAPPTTYQAPPPAGGHLPATTSQYTTAPGQIGGQSATPGNQMHQQQPSYYGGAHAAGPAPQSPYAPPPPHGAPQYAPQDSSSSLSRTAGYAHAYAHQPQAHGQHHPSASQIYAGMPPQQPAHHAHQSSLGPAYSGYGHQAAPSIISSHPSYPMQQQQVGQPPSENSATAYMHQHHQAQQQQYQDQHQHHHQHQQAALSGHPPPHQQSGEQPNGAASVSQPAYGGVAPQAAAPSAPTTSSNPTTSPSPAPTGQYSDTTGKPILFYVKAMYDYNASSAEEFSFQLGDIIAVTGTDPDGWWTGELLDERRREKGKETFPSNFTTLLT